MTAQLALVPLPTVPGKVHGIVQLDPFVRVQCDDCGFVYDGKPGRIAMGITQSGIRFSAKRYHRRGPDRDARRLCRDCRVREWGETE